MLSAHAESESYLIVIALGMLVPVQTAANGRLRGRVQSAWVATLISFAVSSLVLAGAGALAGRGAAAHLCCSRGGYSAYVSRYPHHQAMNTVTQYKYE